MLSIINPLTLHALSLIANSCYFVLFLFPFFICLVAPQVALSTAPSVHVANSKRGRSSGIH